MTKIILARHRETQWNVEEVFRGRIDIELNENGIKQAELLAEYLSNLKIDDIYSSPLKRALKTGEVIASHHELEVKIAPGLIDFDYGKWQGLPHQEVKDKYEELYTEWISQPDQVRIPGGESLNDVRERAINVVNDAVAKHEGNVVLISHRVVNKVLICALLWLDNSHFWQIGQDTGCINILEFGEGFTLRRLNDTSHLVAIEEERVRIDF